MFKKLKSVKDEFLNLNGKNIILDFKNLFSKIEIDVNGFTDEDLSYVKNIIRPFRFLIKKRREVLVWKSILM